MFKQDEFKKGKNAEGEEEDDDPYKGFIFTGYKALLDVLYALIVKQLLFLWLYYFALQ